MPKEPNSCILRLSWVKDLPPLRPLSSPISAHSSPHQAVSQTDIGTSLTGGSDIPKNQLLIQIQCSPESPRVDFTSVITPGLGEGRAGTNGREGEASLGGREGGRMAWLGGVSKERMTGRRKVTGWNRAGVLESQPTSSTYFISPQYFISFLCKFNSSIA